jgi:N-methylhydantoinase A
VVSLRVGVDIGGTFTDLVAQADDGRLHALKVTSTPDDPGDAVVIGLDQLLGHVGAGMEDITEIVHGTTVGSNTILQKVGARTGLLTTKGFRDVLEIGRIRTPVMFDLGWTKPEPLAPRRFRLEAEERMDFHGDVVRPLREDDVRVAGERFLADGVETVAICFLHSHVNPSHEQRAKEILETEFSELLITASCDVLPEAKEYERTSTTVVNAYLLKAMRHYLDHLKARLVKAGLSAPLRVITSHGGMVNSEIAASKPVLAVGSGPAGGVIGSSKLGLTLGAADAIAFDLGGTTAKASLIEGGVPTMTSEYEFRDGISTPSRFVKGGGYMMKVPSIDIAEVGAGGGSLAWIDGGGLLRVGPKSAGADPGPACYGLGNSQPTVTDANVVLGYLNPEGLAGGSLGIRPELSMRAIEREIARPLGLTAIEAAHGIRHIANLEMARAIRSVTVERGRDTREMTLLASGGGGPVHGADVAEILGIRRLVITPLSGVFCSLGMLSADVGQSYVRSILGSLDDLQPGDFDTCAAALREQATEELKEEGFEPDDIQFEFALDARYFAQSSEVMIPYAPGVRRDAIRASFAKAYERMYSHVTDEPIEIVNMRLTATGRSGHLLDFAEMRIQDHETSAGSPTRSAYFGAAGTFVDVPVHQRAEVPPEEPLAGPAIIEAYDTTIVIPAGASARKAEDSSILIDLPARGTS